jgi:hypothetical protein
MRCRESPLLLSQVDAAVSGETSLDPESVARVGGDRPHDGGLIRLRGHNLKGGYDLPDVRREAEAASAKFHGGVQGGGVRLVLEEDKTVRAAAREREELARLRKENRILLGDMPTIVLSRNLNAFASSRPHTPRSRESRATHDISSSSTPANITCSPQIASSRSTCLPPSDIHS